MNYQQIFLQANGNCDLILLRYRRLLNAFGACKLSNGTYLCDSVCLKTNRVSQNSYDCMTALLDTKLNDVNNVNEEIFIFQQTCRRANFQIFVFLSR